MIRGRLISPKVMEFIRGNFKINKYIMYQWDSIKNITNVQLLFQSFDKIITFDYNDYLLYSRDSSKWSFKPLFYLDDFLLKKSKSFIRDIDVLFIGSFHPQRYLILKKLKQYFKLNGYKYYFYIYYPLISYAYSLFFSGNFNMLTFTDFKFTKLSRNDLIGLINRSKIILDIPSISQTGLTIRTLESFASGKKFLTTNKSISSYDFFNKHNIMVIDTNLTNFSLSRDFIESDYQNVSDEILQKYSLKNWLFFIFSEG
jgi:hypothetical protein